MKKPRLGARAESGRANRAAHPHKSLFIHQP
jgi:hypothetical protein